MKRYLIEIAAALLMLAGTLWGQDATPSDPGNDEAQEQAQQSSQGAARVSYIHGDVSSQRGDSGDWVAVTLNTPITTGDRVATGRNSRAEVQLDAANLLRMSSDGNVKIANLTRDNIQLQLGQGLATYSVTRGSEANSEIDTPNSAIHPLGEGEYRIVVNSDSETQVTVRRGSAEISTPQGSTRVEAGQLITIQGTDNPQYRTVEAPPRDDWDRWNADRDSLITRAESWRHTNRYYTGSEELDAYGHWTHVPDYGDVWVPAQPAGWAPYRAGRWVWEPYWGWTWVSYEPWGWAPYHYGRWFVYDDEWVWWPGPVAVYPAYYPVWAPAYVSFFGFGFGGGFHAGFGFGFGNVGWLPCGPGDFFFPWWGRGGFGRRETVINITNININNNNFRNQPGVVAPLAPHGVTHPFSNINSALTNARVRGSISSMPTNQFGKAAVPLHPAPVSAASLRQGGMLTGHVPVVPTRESLRPVNRAVNPSTISTRAGANQRFFAKSQPAPAPRPFTEQAAQVQRSIQASRMGAYNTQNLRTNVAAGTAPNSGMHPLPTNSTKTPVNPGLTAANGSRGSVGASTQTEARPGWHTFGSGSANSRGTLQGPTAQRGRNTAQPPVNRSWQPPVATRDQGRNFPTSSSGVARRNDSAGTGRQGEWHPFKPSTPIPANRGSLPSPQSNRTYQPPPSRNYSRAPLDLRQPIVRQRSSPSYPSYNAGPRGGNGGGAYSPYSRPSGGNYGRPSGGGSYSGPSAGGSGGYRGAPSGGNRGSSSSSSSHGSGSGSHPRH